METSICAECGKSFEPLRAHALFCCAAHKRLFYNRNEERGRTLLPLAQVWRKSKRGATEETTYALKQLCALLDRFNEEDAKAGRSAAPVVRKKIRDKWLAVDYKD